MLELGLGILGSVCAYSNIMWLCCLCSHPLSLLCLAYLLSTRPRFQSSKLSVGAHNQRPSQKGWETLHVKVKESQVAQSFLTLCDPMEWSLPGSSVHGIFQARVLEWGAIAFSGFHVLAVVNSAAVNIGVHVSFSVMFFSGYMPSNGIVSVTMFLQGCLLF